MALKVGPPKGEKSGGKLGKMEAGREDAEQHVIKDVSFLKSVKLGLF